MNDTDQGVRLAKRVAALRACSRSQAEALIVRGAVRVDGQVVTDPARRVREEVLQIEPGAVWASAAMTVLLHKPAGALADVALRSAWPALGHGPWPMQGLREWLPLPQAASGLAVWSNDPAVVRCLHDGAHPREQEWMLGMPVVLSEAVLAQLQRQALRTSLGHERGGMGGWRVVGYSAPDWGRLAMTGQHSPGVVWQRLRIGRLGLSPLEAGQARIKRHLERF